MLTRIPWIGSVTSVKRYSEHADWVSCYRHLDLQQRWNVLPCSTLMVINAAVVDTGMHALQWSQEEALQYMLQHTASSEQSLR